MTREKLERWLKYAERVEAEAAEADDKSDQPAAPPADADVEAWTPKSADPFGMKWAWLFGDIEERR